MATVTTTGALKRTHFEGTEKDARTYVEQNFPRIHSDGHTGSDPIPDVVVNLDDDSTDFFHGPETGWNSELASETVEEVKV